MAPHPWSLTLRQFLAKAQSDYGVTLRTLAFPLNSSKGPVRFQYLERTDLVEVFALMLGIGEDEVLAPTVLRSLCRQLDLPPEDFHLDFEESDQD